MKLDSDIDRRVLDDWVWSPMAGLETSTPQNLDWLNGRFGETRVSKMGRLNSVTNGRFQVSEFNDSFPAMNLKRRRSPCNLKLTFEALRSMSAGIN
ncbi:hypothetical protein GO003_000435 [Methylicorpusculum oleiharenae]|uniref:hypothetical protein n=1 Tax=Methylicorpusculum oleiharenae TaxID=1338687 RepID=UPI00135AFD06|nr:hypothetical protein [Methylicorpusculum oleiharenae]MCD2448868.1 hypothetical protein [Methylicorpusculum oleiharenae]